ncbi:MAG: hypothetical protein QGF03_10770, partial [SAR324 cluster bacterium]|nr:hypothetical protein [SAR324 cluster bacterium]
MSHLQKAEGTKYQRTVARDGASVNQPPAASHPATSHSQKERKRGREEERKRGREEESKRGREEE